MRTDDFDYDLPEGLIARNPVVPRDNSRLFVYDTVSDSVSHRHFYDLVDYFNDQDLFVLNRSRVIPARILFDGNKEIFLLKSLGSNKWQAMVRPGKFFSDSREFFLNDGVKCFVREVLDDGTRVIESDGDLLEYGETPLPPYIKGSGASADQYQTVYSKELGSVAAPTAGLHFTDRLLSDLSSSGVKFAEVVLHVGRGTFLPVSSSDLSSHVMHEEEYLLDAKNASILNSSIDRGGRVVAVGTTSVRVLESAFDGAFKEGSGSTDIFIYPGSHEWKVVDSLITNFHLPKSTLIMLVASFLEHKGVKSPVKKCMELYKLAIDESYRFYSFGDAMLII